MLPLIFKLSQDATSLDIHIVKKISCVSMPRKLIEIATASHIVQLKTKQSYYNKLPLTIT